MQRLPYRLYCEPERSAQEASLFAGSWQFVCHASDLPAPGTAARFDCAGRSAVVLRTRSGELQAFRNACRHRGSRLVEGDPHTGLAFCVDGRLRCPYHGWTYDETGALVAIPDGQHFDADFDPGQHALITAQVAQWRGLVFVAFERPRTPVAAALQDAAAGWPDLAMMRRLIEPRGMTCAADWKLAVEHLLDTAHAGIARPGGNWQVFAPAAFEAMSGISMRARAGLDADRANDAWSVRASRALLRRIASCDAACEQVFLWPNTLLQLAPDGLVVLQVLPVGTGACAYRESRYAVPDTARDMQVLRYLQRRSRRQALQVDARLLARVQQGMLQGVPPGPIAGNEAGLRWFTARYREHHADAVESPRLTVAPRKTRSRPRAPTEA